MAEASGYLLDESFLDIDVHFNDLMSSKWQNTTDAIDTVCATLEDYCGDYSYLKPRNFDRVISMAQVDGTMQELSVPSSRSYVSSVIFSVPGPGSPPLHYVHVAEQPPQAQNQFGDCQ